MKKVYTVLIKNKKSKQIIKESNSFIGSSAKKVRSFWRSKIFEITNDPNFNNYVIDVKIKLKNNQLKIEL